MRLNILLPTSILALMLGSCIKHEVIPAPEHKANLKAYFNGNVNNSQTEFTENVVGYYGSPDKTQDIQPAGSTSSEVYLFTMRSDQATSSIQVGMGSLTWDQANASGPALDAFNNFFNTNTSPSYSDGGTNGFFVTYKDNTGTLWTSSENSVNSQTVVFTNVSQESDPNGDYSKFTCNFSCWAYNAAHDDSIHIQNAQLKGWFRRQ